MKKEVYKKFYNRSLPLMSVEEWYQGEHVVLPKLLHKKIYFDHLFVYALGKGTDVYYRPAFEAVRELVYYFHKNPGRLDVLFEEYVRHAREIIAVCKRATAQDIPRIYKLTVENVWPMIAISMVLGGYAGRYGMHALEKKGIRLRKKSDVLIYTVGWKIWALAKKKFPQRRKYIDFLTIKEIVRGRLPSLKILERRRQGYIYFRGKLIVGQSLQKLAKSENIEIVDDRLDQVDKIVIRGSSASRGKVVGKVRLVLEIAQMRKVRKGDILVTSMTVPDFLPAMKKAAAFVTDEGGVTCHAAIVAREMKKPCVIGTKIATKVLKDGDVVEVDANKGRIRIINKHGKA